MLTVRILCVGKCKEKYWREACAEYGKRLSAFCRFEVLEVDEERLPERPSKAQIESGLEQEGKRLLQKAGSTPIVALCIEGKELSSPQLAQYVERAAVNGASSLAFVIGGSWGLWEEVKRKAALRAPRRILPRLRGTRHPSAPPGSRTPRASVWRRPASSSTSRGTSV